jgi:hypothetical protein
MGTTTDSISVSYLPFCIASQKASRRLKPEDYEISARLFYHDLLLINEHGIAVYETYVTYSLSHTENPEASQYKVEYRQHCDRDKLDEQIIHLHALNTEIHDGHIQDKSASNHNYILGNRM